ncbi:hypothetical protein [Pseudovibrio ascidiaceicola]|uniref:hypothetical protein n=1 Tax=Pseudovibrio ascidiaceicola TaxID=285279 RepID=UPI000D689EB4|nr:hypothetical protein [Pseudovibrio ascidiaceicola]
MTEIAKSSEALSHLDQCGEYAAAMDGLQKALRACRSAGEGANDTPAVEAANNALRAAVGLYQVAEDAQIRDAIKFVFENYATYSPDVAKKNAATLFYIFKREKTWVGALYEGGLQCLKTSNRMPEVSAFYRAVAEQQKKLSSELRLIKTIQHS